MTSIANLSNGYFASWRIQISRRYGIMCVDTKIAVDGVYHMLGKPLPDATAPEEKAPPPPKGKKAAKDTKKGEVLVKLKTKHAATLLSE